MPKNPQKQSSSKKAALRNAILADAVSKVDLFQYLVLPTPSVDKIVEKIASDNEQITAKPTVTEEKPKDAGVPALHSWGATTAKIRQALSQYAQSAAANSNKANELLAIIERAHALLDIRENDIRELSDILFSGANLVAAAEAYGVDNPIRHLKLTGHSTKARQHLQSLYAQSAAVRDNVDRLLAHEQAIFLIATIMSGEERRSNYAAFLGSNPEGLDSLQKKVTDLEVNLQGFSAEELKELHNDPQVMALNEGRAQLTIRQNARRELESEICRSLAGERDVQEALVPLRGLPIRQSDFEIPEPWQKTIQEEGFILSDDPGVRGKNFIRICNRNYKYIYQDVRTDIVQDRELNFKRTITELRKHSRLYDTFLDMLLDLNSCGFLLVDDGFCHPQYNIKFDSKTADGKDPLAYAYEIKEKYLERLFQQDSLLRSIARAGANISRGKEGSIIISYPDMPTIEFKERGWFRDVDFTAAETFLNDVIRKKSNRQPDKELVALPVPVEPEVQTPYVWQPPAGRTVVAYDSNTLQRLATPRENQQTWLDLIEQTSRLPNVTVMIPAVIADWELQGRIPIFDEEGVCTGKFKQVDRGFLTQERLKRIREPINAFLDSASRGRITSEGNIIVQPNHHPNAKRNIIIIDMQDDQKLYQNMRHIMLMPNKQVQIEHFTRDISGQDKGEEAITRMVRALPGNVAATIISDDFKYFRKSGTPRSTARGMPVGQSSTACYLEAEIMAREDFLRRSALKESNVLTVNRIGSEIKEYWKRVNGDGITLSEHCEPGKYGKSHDHKPDTIYTLIKHGVEQLQAMPALSSGSQQIKSKPHANAELRKAVAPSPIAPNGVNNRSDTGAVRK